MIASRRVSRRIVPFAVRWRFRAPRRCLADVRGRVRFADLRGGAGAFTYRVCSYARPLISYAGQESRFAAKKHNVELALSRIDALVVEPGETLSFWRAVGRPTARAGYARAAALKDGVLVDDVGGAICLASTLLYNIGLLSGMAIEERWCHSVDSYGDARYFELGRDAAVEYAYRDLRLRNVLRVPIRLSTSVQDGAVLAESWSQRVIDLRADVSVSAPACEGRVMSVRTVRSVSLHGAVCVEDLGASTYRLAHDR